MILLKLIFLLPFIVLFLFIWISRLTRHKEAQDEIKERYRCLHKSIDESGKKVKEIIEKIQSISEEELIESVESKREVSKSKNNLIPKSNENLIERSKVTPRVRLDVLHRDNYTCQICGISPKSGAILHVDHIYPISKGGKSIMENLQTLCSECNLGKGSKIY